ncbi:MAG: Na+-translocating ferredoxin:NAD+ oxidoreductase subunit B [Azoarcus sp.]|jgi:electron transport complex protein RnfB|nr:Na+-translocating ferredoxin:NAD+ oxidoreductase subunit B [Azoarcus sp.]
MLVAVSSLTVLGAVLGVLLGFASRRFHVEGNPVVAEVETLMPGSNCGQCGFPGCAGAAAAIVGGEAPATCCPPGGKALAQSIAAKLGLEIDLSTVVDAGPQLAVVTEDICIGCCRCIKVCPTDAILGGAKQIHAVLREACTGCGNCVDRCPTEAIGLKPVPITLQHWVWPNPARA